MRAIPLPGVLVGLPLGLLIALLVHGHGAVAAEPTLARITLSSGGVGQFDFAADVDGGASLALDVPLDQVDDLLKSLRIEDEAGGASVSLPGREPLSESFRTLPFGPDALASSEALLQALIGEAVRLPTQGIAGTILAVTASQMALPDNGGTTTRHRLTIATETGIETVTLEDVHGIEFASQTLRRQVGAALAAIAARRVQDRRTLSITLAAGGRRSVGFSYVVPVPVWKPTYRLTVPADGTAGPVHLQADAVVENLSGRDWRGVALTLTSGQPVLYHQPLYEAVFTTRPEAPVDVANRLTPSVDQGEMAAGAPAPPPPPAPAAIAPMRRMRALAAPAAEPAAAIQSAAQVQFRLAAPVTAASGETVLLPVIDRDVPGRRVALYQPETDALHPLVAVLLRNDTAGALPPALATLYQRGADDQVSFVGDARLPAILPGEERLASFAADLAVRIDVSQAEAANVVSGTIAGGVMTLAARERWTTTYRIAMPPGSGRTLVVETSRRPGFTLAEPADATLTPTAFRVTRDYKPGEQATLRVVQEQPRGERVALGDLDATRLLATSDRDGLPAPVKAAVRHAADLRVELDRRRTALDAIRDRRRAIVDDQARLRSNLAAVPANSELQRRYLAQMTQQENDLATLQTQADAAQRAVAEAQAALKSYLQDLTI